MRQALFQKIQRLLPVGHFTNNLELITLLFDNIAKRLSDQKFVFHDQNFTFITLVSHVTVFLPVLSHSQTSAVCGNNPSVLV